MRQLFFTNTTKNTIEEWSFYRRSKKWQQSRLVIISAPCSTELNRSTDSFEQFSAKLQQNLVNFAAMICSYSKKSLDTLNWPTAKTLLPLSDWTLTTCAMTDRGSFGRQKTLMQTQWDSRSTTKKSFVVTSIWAVSKCSSLLCLVEK